MHVKGFCTLGKHNQMLYVFLNCHFCAGQPPKGGQNVSLDVKAAFPWGFPKEWAVFSWDLKKINEMPIYSSTSNYNCHRVWNVLASISPCPLSGVRPIKAPDSNQQIIP